MASRSGRVGRNGRVSLLNSKLPINQPEVPESGLLFTLCVPTYNRSALLKLSLQAILAQLGPAEAAQVEVLVLDNASPDDTPQIIAEVKAEFPHVRVRCVRHSQNIGPDANYAAGIREARGRFVYLLSDDDVLLPGAVAKLLDVAQAHPSVDAIALNVREFWNSSDEQSPGVFALSEDRLLATPEEALVFLASHIGFLSCLAVRRENICRNDYAGKLDTNFVHIYFFLDALAPGGGLYATAQPYLAQRSGNSGGFNVFKVVVTNFYDAMQYARRIGYAPDAVQKVLTLHLSFIYQCVLAFKSKEIGTLQPRYGDGIVRLLKTYGPTRLVVFRVIPRMLVPRPLFSATQTAYKFLKKSFHY